MKNPPNKLELSAQCIRAVDPAPARILYWDTKEAGLALQVQPSGHKSFKVIYRHNGRPRWFNIGTCERVGLKEAREAARRIKARVTLGQDPQGEKVAQRPAAKAGGRFGSAWGRYLEQVAKPKQKAWQQGAYLRRRYVLPKIGDKKLADVTRVDLEALFDALTAEGHPVLANQVLAHTSAVMSWAVSKHLISFNP